MAHSLSPDNGSHKNSDKIPKKNAHKIPIKKNCIKNAHTWMSAECVPPKADWESFYRLSEKLMPLVTMGPISGPPFRPSVPYCCDFGCVSAPIELLPSQAIDFPYPQYFKRQKRFFFFYLDTFDMQFILFCFCQ